MRARSAALLAAVSAACVTSRSDRASPLVGHAVEVAAPDLGGAVVPVTSDGARVRVVDFWASWCDPCREQLPALDRLARALGPQGVTVYAVSFDEDRALLEAFLAAHPVAFPVLWDRGGRLLSDRLSVHRLPTTLVLDAGGVVRHAHLGYDAADEARIEREVRALLGR
jgi:thiol-disulfide isomerase/thioredoxin